LTILWLGEAVAIRVARGFLRHVNDFRDGFTIQVRDVEDRVAASAALVAAMRNWSARGRQYGAEVGLGPEDEAGPKSVSAVIDLPTGPAMVIDSLKTLAKSTIPELAYASLEIRRNFNAALGPGLLRRRAEEPDPPGALGAARVALEAVPDIFPWQILGPGHLENLPELTGSLPPEEGTLRKLDFGFAELELGSIEDLLHDPEDLSQIRTSGRRLLGPCLLTRTESHNLLAARQTAAAQEVSKEDPA
jgi:hypothetical protein